MYKSVHREHRNPMQYQPAYAAARPILTAEEKAQLAALARRYPLATFRADTRNYDELAVDFVYTSAKIEGNTYDRLDTDNLLRLGITAGGKRYSDAVMLLNLRHAFEHVMQTEAHTRLDMDYLGNLHHMLMDGLLPAHEQGIVRTSPVSISGPRYRPPADPLQLRTEAKYILEQADQYRDPFEQAIYLHCNLAYLQYFRDGNKRTARLMQTAALVRGVVMPLFFHDSLIERYQRATVHYYESGDYAPYIAFVKDNYRLTIESLTGADTLARLWDDHARARTDALAALQHGTPAERLFYQHAEEAIARAGDVAQVNWAETERRTLTAALEHDISISDIVRVLCQHSPGATTPTRQAALDEDARRLAARQNP